MSELKAGWSIPGQKLIACFRALCSSNCRLSLGFMLSGLIKLQLKFSRYLPPPTLGSIRCCYGRVVCQDISLEMKRVTEQGSFIVVCTVVIRALWR
jgi:hypothetical protein